MTHNLLLASVGYDILLGVDVIQKLGPTPGVCDVVREMGGNETERRLVPGRDYMPEGAEGKERDDTEEHFSEYQGFCVNYLVLWSTVRG